MKLTILTDNNTLIDRYLMAEPGFCVHLEVDGVKILLDTGYSDVFLRNASKMGLSLRDLDVVALSHSHLDHTWGLEPLIRHFTESAFEKLPCKRPKLLYHPDALLSRTFHQTDEFGMLMTESRLARYFALQPSKEPYFITDKLAFLGHIERRFDFEAKTPIGKVLVDGSLQDDYMQEDSALAYNSSQGLVIITGCSHSGICNIIEQAKDVFKTDTVLDVIGGFHLQKPKPEQLEGTLQYFKQLKPASLHACHCTDLQSKIRLAAVAPIEEVGAGLTLTYP